MPGRTRHYASAAVKQAAYRRRKKFQESDTARLIALQEDYAQLHVGVRGRMLRLQQQATAEQRQLQAELKERDMMDALWTLQTLIADFGYDEVYTHVLQHLCPPPSPAFSAPWRLRKSGVVGAVKGERSECIGVSEANADP